jgi:hypothetical protein
LRRTTSEVQAIELVAESSAYFAGKVSEKVLTSFEPFFLATSDLEEESGFFILKGSAPEVFKLMEEERYRPLASAGAGRDRAAELGI